MKQVFFFALTVFLLASCTKDSVNVSEEINIELRNKRETFKVSIEALDGGDIPYPFSPGIYLVQKKNSAPIFENGEPDLGKGLEAIAEDGMPGTLNGNLRNHPKVRKHGMYNTPVGTSGPAPIFAGDKYEFYVTAKPNDHLNFITMFIQSNDLFVAPSENGIPLFDQYGNPKEGDITGYLSIWDAGTEVNEEPGVGPNQAPRQSGPNTGIDENGVVMMVNDGFDYPSLSDVIRVTISVE